MNRVTVSAKGWVTIPVEIRRKYGLDPGAQVRVVDYGGVIALVPLPEDPVQVVQGMLAGGPSLTEELLAEHARERASERADD